MSLSLCTHLVVPFFCALPLYAEADSQHHWQPVGDKSSLLKWVLWFVQDFDKILRKLKVVDDHFSLDSFVK